jgi:transporter family-2 protein
VKNIVFLGAVSALSTGVLIGIQSFNSGRSGSIVGPFATGLWTNFLGGTLAGILILLVLSFAGSESVRISRPVFFITFISGALGILIIMGIAFAISKAGVAAGLAGTIFGQFLFGVLADSFGWGGVDPIPLDPRRIFGLVFMSIAVFLLLPKR